MPELPEVEIIRRQLNEYLVGYSVESIDVRGGQVVHGEIQDLVGARVTQVRRRGKGIIIDFDNHQSLAIHLKMTGQIIYRETKWQGGKDAEKEKEYKLSEKVGKLPGVHTHVIFKLKVKSEKFLPEEDQPVAEKTTLRQVQGESDKAVSEACLYYNDIRKFGWLHVLPTNEVSEHKFFKMLGLEPFLDLDFESFSEILSARTPIKTLLMDQSRIAGVGNIYANESLWMSKIHPRRQALLLSPSEVRLLYSSLLEVMEKSLTLGASSESTYVNALGQEGSFQNHFQVYHRDGTPCPRCSTILTRFVMGGRGTFVCTKCQVEQLGS